MTIQFLHAILWNTINVFLYKILLQTHQTCLFYVISKQLFGISGTIFSSIYFLISITNFGFDYSLFSFYQQYSTDQQEFQKLIKQYVMRFFITCIIVACCFAAQGFLSHVPTISFFTDNVPYALMPCLASIFITESLKKSLETLAQLSFLNKSITILEISTIATYLAIVWSSYFVYGTINLYSIFIPMMLTSFIELLLLIKRLYLFYKTLPTTHCSSINFVGPCPTTCRSAATSHFAKASRISAIIANQAVNYLNQVAKALFSPNFLILLLAYRLGMVKAGYIKLFTDIIILLYMLLNRAVGTPSGALLSRLPQGTMLNQQTIKETFLKITNVYIQLLYALAITIAAALVPCILKSSCFHPTITISILLFILAGFIEYIVITYEKLFITQNASKTLAMINLGSMLCLALILYQTSNSTSPFILLPIIMIRCVTVSTIALVAYKRWSIFPTLTMRYQTALIALFTSCCCLTAHYLL